MYVFLVLLICPTGLIGKKNENKELLRFTIKLNVDQTWKIKWLVSIQ